MKARIYHNPRCSKSRATKALLDSRGIPLEVIEYLHSPPSPETLTCLLAKLGMKARELIRKNEPEFKAANVDLRNAEEAELIELMSAQPKIMQRPIVEVEGAARLGRPPECVLDLFQ
jgi:arsenate reductase